MPEHNRTDQTRYYVIERVGVEPHERFLTKLGHQLMLIFSSSFAQKPTDPTFGSSEHWFKWDTYTAACHWLARWKPPGTYRVMRVEEDADGDALVYEWAQQPVDQERFDERDWKEFHHMNGKSN
tara:strand:+ start:198 stop:569 length:372 start_codon:yes stop_codon:yes gene_type:complete